jgi:hypothetical protein
MDPDEQMSRPSPKGYGKRPMWQWVLIYVVVGGLVYFLIYWLFIRGGSAY